MAGKRIFICSPYAGDVERNVETARKLCRKAIKAGHAPFAPHLHYPGIVNDSNEEERAAGIASGLHFMDICDEVWAYIGQGRSPGMLQELRHATVTGKRIRYFHRL
jgi:hypothetical protein